MEVAEVNESWTARNEDWVMVDSGAGVSACPVDFAPEGEVSSGSVKLPHVGARGDRIEHIGQKTVGYVTRDGANVEIAFEAAKVRRPLLSVDSVVEKGQVAVFTDSGGFEVCSAGGSSGEETGHEASERTLLATTCSTC